MADIKEISRKCKYCDGTGEKTIIIGVDDYLLVKKGSASFYAHTECYRMALLKKKINKEDIENEINYYKKIEEDNATSTELKDKFYYKIMDMYNITSIPSAYILRVNDIVFGRYKNMRGNIEYSELYEMISNPKLVMKLNSIAKNKNVSDGIGRMFWDLTVIIGEYDNYRKYKIRQQQQGQFLDEELEKQIQTINSVKKSVNKMKENIKEDEIDMSDLML